MAVIYDPVKNPKHYVEHSITLQPIHILRFAPFDLGNALKYMIRAGYKDNMKQDLEKALFYINVAIETYAYDGSVYDKFFKNHKLYLNMFEALPNIEEENALESMETYKESITTRIMNLPFTSKESKDA